MIGSSARATTGLPGDPTIDVAPGQYDHKKALQLKKKQPCVTIPRSKYPPTQFVSHKHSKVKEGMHSPGPVRARVCVCE